MSDVGGFIKLHRKITDWEWYQNPNTFRVFLHCLLMANYTDGRFEGKEISRGQLVTSLPNMADQTNLTIQQVRTALNHLKSTGEITDKAYPKYRVITIVKYNDYQQDNRQINRQSTGNQQQYKNNKNIRKKEGKNRKEFIVPTTDDVDAYCDEKGIFGFDSQKFVDYYTSNGWMVGRNKMKDWKAAVRTWLRNDESRQQKKDLDLPY